MCVGCGGEGQRRGREGMMLNENEERTVFFIFASLVPSLPLTLPPSYPHSLSSSQPLSTPHHHSRQADRNTDKHYEIGIKRDHSLTHTHSHTHTHTDTYHVITLTVLPCHIVNPASNPNKLTFVVIMIIRKVMIQKDVVDDQK